MKVYVFERHGKEWADVALPHGVKAQRVIDCVTSRDALDAATKETGRVQAMLERVASDLSVAQPTYTAPASVQQGGFGRRLKWLLTGK